MTCTQLGCLSPEAAEVVRRERDYAVAGFQRLVERNAAMRMFLLELLDPEGLGHAVTPEVHERARVLLGIGGPR